MNDIGQVLKEERLALGLDIDEVARRTCICGRYLRAIEDGNFQAIPKVFDKGYLKIYANYLHVDTKLILALYEQKLRANKTVPEH